ncbi:TetR/AcrR family transcriptional regulator [Streptomyces griseoviridis]|jgi:TetR/AcrR family transcriptional repressor of nem operon|uniref:TetR/AcrR family transcriptional repressor of nem operon n=3 Tax=Streptomyces TaxID=1883 RepID=A0ABT9LM44_STRGD|nr:MULTISPECIES: TetR/AcrR family transcriptional regulator [Streptomyces]MDP9684612.1 TetR/AcrR family transcriptional repressor of nem operon [Streptomyces griseoviridis]GGS64002.1 TetR family transcriptional regulator [Streptomyces niveoruber]GGT20866.1 TetR family transcriptional regulator [Streptomyces griseoviridis]
MPTTTRSAATRRGILDAAQRIMARKGYSGVGINEVLAEAGVPKGSFYHYFASKDAFGEALLKRYFDEYVSDMDRLLARPGTPAAERLMAYWRQWRETQSVDECQGKCLAVKLGAEVADLSEPMRLAMKTGTDAIVDRLERAITGGLADGSITVDGDPRGTAQALYDMWLGASVMAKIHRGPAPLDTALTVTRHLLHL